jgi:hypothetical protein
MAHLGSRTFEPKIAINFPYVEFFDGRRPTAKRKDPKPEI